MAIMKLFVLTLMAISISIHAQAQEAPKLDKNNLTQAPKSASLPKNKALKPEQPPSPGLLKGQRLPASDPNPSKTYPDPEWVPKNDQKAYPDPDWQK